MKYSYDLSSLYNEDDISYYILGAFIADGNITTHGLDHFRLSASGKSASELSSWLYYPGAKIAMPRKASIAKQIITKFS